MNQQLCIFFGAPGSGKSTCLDYLKNHHGNSFEVIAKEITRPPRATDSYEVLQVNEISDNCDIYYSQYGNEYGARTNEIWRHLKSGKSTAIIINDIRTIRILKQKFGVLCKIIYIHSNIDEQSLKGVIKERNSEMSEDELEEDTKKRIDKISTIHRKYIENTSLFDYTILNVEDTFQTLYRQVDQIIDHTSFPKLREKSSVRLFIIVGASYSGKDELVNALERMEVNRVKNYRKVTNRPKREQDKGELRHRKSINRGRYLVYEKQGFKYGLSTSEIWNDLSKGKIVLLVLSDLDTIKQVLGIFGNVCTVLYTHANFNEREIVKKMHDNGLSFTEIDDRVQNIKSIFELYLASVEIFDHVLLNTAEAEDLYDQAFNILDYYC